MYSDLGYGFSYGKNTVTKTKVEGWLHSKRTVNWKAFLWYIADYCDIEGYGADWLVIKLVSSKQREFFYKKVMEYNDEIAVHNYEVDKENDLWKSHKKGFERNPSILQQLVL